VASHQGIYASHIRDEEADLLRSLDEVLRIGQGAALPVHVSHLKAGARVVWGKSANAIDLQGKATRKRGA
jgi:N-acyl-D-amino-acid deacylase